MRCEECGKEFSFIGKNTLCAECFLKGTIDKKPKKEKQASEKKSVKTEDKPKSGK